MGNVLKKENVRDVMNKFSEIVIERDGLTSKLLEDPNTKVIVFGKNRRIVYRHIKDSLPKLENLKVCRYINRSDPKYDKGHYHINTNSEIIKSLVNAYS